MKIDQVAFLCLSREQADQIKNQLGLADKKWVLDIVTAKSVVADYDPMMNVAELQFNYDLGIEVEILRYIKGPNWHHFNPLAGTAYNRNIVNAPIISHVGIHLDDGKEFPKMASSRLVQETWTESHTGEYLTDPKSPGFGRKYHYRVFELSPGSYIKFIRRVHPKR